MAECLVDDPDNLHTIRATTPVINTTTTADKKHSNITSSSDAGVRGSLPSPVETEGKTTTSSTTATKSYRFSRSKSLRSESSSSSRQSYSAGRRNIGIVIGDFTRIYPDELTLSLGERIEILSKHVDVSRNIGWWTARNSRGETGLVPVNCVKVITSSVSSEEDCSSTVPYMEGSYPIEIPPEEIKLLNVIGVGGFGRVHRAIYKGEEVAVKVARQTNYDTVKVISEVLAEAEKFAKLAHENVCALVGVSLIKDVYLVMEYAKGGTLSSIVHDKGIVVPIDVTLDWALQISDGMKYLHHEVHPCMIHRDLKSTNILLQNAIDEVNFHNNIIKITDFGLAREIEHTTRMSAAGTYPWMAPEVIKASEFSTKSDVWSFGVVVWELLTGEKPYTGLNMYLVAYGVGSGSLKLPIHKLCPQSLAILLQECWQRSYADRPTFRSIHSKLANLASNPLIMEMDYEQFKSLQLSWKLDIQKCFQEHKKNESGFEEKQKDLLSKMRKQDQKVVQLEKEKKELVNMIEKFHLELQKLSETEQRPPRLKPFSFRRLFEKMVIARDVKVKDSSRAETLAKEIERRMKDIDATEDLLARHSPHGGVSRKICLPVPSSGGHTRQPSDPAVSGATGTIVARGSPTLAIPQRSGSLNSKQNAGEYRRISPPSRMSGEVLPVKPIVDPAVLHVPKRYNSYDNIVPSTDSGSGMLRERAGSFQYDSGKHSLTSSDTFSQNLIDFENDALKPTSIVDALDPLSNTALASYYQQSQQLLGGQISHDSLFSESISPVGGGPVTGVRGFSPPPNQFQGKSKLRNNISPRNSNASDIYIQSRPRPRPNNQDSTSAPTSRPGTPKLRPQSGTISPSGSVHSLPPYSTSTDGEVIYFATAGDSSTSIDDKIFDEIINLNADLK